MQIVTLRRDGRGIIRDSERNVDLHEARLGMAQGASAVVVHEPQEVEGLPQRITSSSFYVSRPAILAVAHTTGRRRLHRFAHDSDVSLEGDRSWLAQTLLDLGCIEPALPPPGKRFTLVRFTDGTHVAGWPVTAGCVAAIDFDPMAVLPELRGLGLFPWEVMAIDDLGDDGCHGEALETVRLTLLLDQPWYPARAPSPFLAGLQVETSYRDYRRQLPSAQVLSARRCHTDPPPRAVLGRS